MSAREVNFDGLIGPSHNYGGLSDGNLASSRNAGDVSNPREAALQGLEKMRTLLRAGLTQGVLPPLPRPNFDLLVSAGFSGSDRQIIEQAAEQAPRLLKIAYSGSMWTANAATVSPSADTQDGRLHLTAANLSTMLHRSLEHPDTTASLQAIFGDDRHFAVHAALPMHADFADEGAANHVRLCATHGAPGVELFVYGRDAGESTAGSLQKAYRAVMGWRRGVRSSPGNPLKRSTRAHFIMTWFASVRQTPCSSTKPPLKIRRRLWTDCGKRRTDCLI